MRQECDSCTTTHISVMAFTVQGNLITKLVIRGTSWLSQMSSRGGCITGQNALRMLLLHSAQVRLAALGRWLS